MQHSTCSAAGEDVRCISFPQQQQSAAGGEAHVCSRHCAYAHVLGNLYTCSTSGTNHIHVCDQNCNQRIYYDSYHTICRLSKKLFPNTEARMTDGHTGKRASDSGGMGKEKRSLTEREWVAQQALVDAATANTAWCKAEVAAWQQIAQQQAH